MAKSRKKTPEPPEKQNSSADFVAKVRSRYQVMKDGDYENRREGMLDLRFAYEPGFQWDDDMKRFRGDRPCYEFNEIRIKCKRIINDMRSNRPQAKVRGYEDADKKTAEILEGLYRNIWNCSDGDTIVDAAGEYQVAAGMACWRIVTDYETDASFDQDIYIEGIRNPFNLYCDPAAQDSLKRDADDWILTERITRKSYEERWPKKEVVSFDVDNEFDDEEDWGIGEKDPTIRIAEYWFKETIDVELWKLSNGAVVDASDPAAAQIPPEQIVGKRTGKGHQIKMAIVSGNAILEPARVCAGKEHRFVMVYGETIVINGETKWFGLPRFAKDAQKNLNITQTATLESTAQSLQSKFWTTLKQAEGHVEKWQESIQKNIPFAFYNADPQAPGPPVRVGGPDVPVAMLELSRQASELMKTVTGIYDASLGAPSNEQTGRAIIARQQQSDIATFNYQDNMAKGIQRTAEIILDLIPHVYDTERSLRILGADGAEDYVKVNQFVPNPQDPHNPLKINDLSQGKYDVTITTGPNFSTKRQEATEMYGQLIQQFPQIMGVAGDLVAKSWDLPYSEQIAERLQTLLPPQIQQQMQKGKDMPPEVMQAMAQVDQAMQQVQQQGQLVQQAAQEAQQQQAAADKGKAEIQTAIANLKTQQAQFDAEVAKQLAGLEIAQMKAEQALTTGVNEKERQDLTVAVSQAVAEIQRMGAEFMQTAAGTMADMNKQARPKLIAVHTVRQNGGMVSTPVYGDQPQ